MNFYPIPPVIQAEILTQIPAHLRCTGQPTDWRGGSALPASDIFLEGPVYSSDGELYVTDIPYGRILKIDAQKQVTECVKYDGEPNGLVIREDGCIVIADYKQGLLIFDPSTGALSPLLARRNMERFKGPNDLVVSSKNEIYFTDQGQTGMSDPTGRVYRLCPDGRLDCLVDNGVSPNGIALSPDERFLYVAMTRSNSVWRLPLNSDGSTTKAGLFFQSFGTSGPDGLTVDEDGNLFICHPSLASVFVVDADGIPKARIVTSSEGGKNLTNCTFGGEDGKTLFITDSMKGNIQFVRWHCGGSVKPKAVKTR
ncbi:unnamed protein product [Penicillium bialowiezense]